PHVTYELSWPETLQSMLRSEMVKSCSNVEPSVATGKVLLSGMDAPTSRRVVTPMPDPRMVCPDLGCHALTKKLSPFVSNTPEPMFTRAPSGIVRITRSNCSRSRTHVIAVPGAVAEAGGYSVKLVNDV